MKKISAKPLTDVPAAFLGECPVWLPAYQRLFWLDIEGKRLFSMSESHDDIIAYALPSLVGCIVPFRNGDFLMAAQDGISPFRCGEPAKPDDVDGFIEFVPEETEHTDNAGCLEKKGRLFKGLPLAHPESDRSGNRYNDGKCSPEGRFLFGSLSMTRTPGQASLYVLEPDAGGQPVVRKLLSGATNSNGLAWSPDGETLYWIDTPTRQVEAFRYDPVCGMISRRRTVIRFPQDAPGKPLEELFGRPDGMTVDAEGQLWIAHYAGSRVTRWNPETGKLSATITLPVSRVTCPVFGGPNLDRLYITTAKFGMTTAEREREPLAGRLFVAEPDVRGLEVSYFRTLPAHES